MAMVTVVSIAVVSETIQSVLLRSFKVQHMSWRESAQPHVGRKFHLSEDDLFMQMCLMGPIHERHPERMDVIFRSGDVRSTLNARLMEKASVPGGRQSGTTPATSSSAAGPISWVLGF